MSILNVSMGAERALVAVDSAVDIGGAASQASKLVHLPVPHCVLAIRGHTSLLADIVANVMRAGGLLDFDTLAAGMRTGLDNLAAHYLQQLASFSGREVTDFEAEVALVGWSPSATAMKGWAFVRMAGSDHFDQQAIDDFRLGPNANWSALPATPRSAGDMKLLARDQAAFMAERHPEATIGGRLIVAELQRGAVSIVDHGPIGRGRP